MKFLMSMVLFAIVSSASAQVYPDIQVDTSLKTSEFYVDEFKISSGLGSGYWKLDDDYKLRFGERDDTPPNPSAKVIGKWTLYKDTLLFTIEKRTAFDPGINPAKERPNTLKFRVINLKWTTLTTSKTENGHPLTLTTFCTVLTDKPVDSGQLQSELTAFIKDNLKSEKEDLFLELMYVEQVNQAVRKFFFEKQLFYGTKTYWNGNLRKYP
ncbi:MAG: hypothetical protein HOP08_02435 [Cyclobacteriaceae bacterium]|nr:hypothetical protein [Cyclobacteriaceae bacterium]